MIFSDPVFSTLQASLALDCSLWYSKPLTHSDKVLSFPPTTLIHAFHHHARSSPTSQYKQSFVFRTLHWQFINPFKLSFFMSPTIATASTASHFPHHSILPHNTSCLLSTCARTWILPLRSTQGIYQCCLLNEDKCLQNWGIPKGISRTCLHC